MKDLFNILLDTALALLVAGMVLYALLCVGAYTLSADEVLTEEERVVALTILGEARGEGKIGMFAVGCIIQKRASERNLTPAKVCLEPWQFSVWNAGQGKVKKESDLYHLWESKSMMYARKLARSVCDPKQTLTDVTGGANHYCAVSCKPSWARGKKPVKIIGNHKFYKL
jgi:spore germination cell wall hydrolase CwlJ-like protein